MKNRSEALKQMALERACERENRGKEQWTEQSGDDFFEPHAPQEALQMKLICEEWLWQPSCLQRIRVLEVLGHGNADLGFRRV